MMNAQIIFKINGVGKIRMSSHRILHMPSDQIIYCDLSPLDVSCFLDFYSFFLS